MKKGFYLAFEETEDIIGVSVTLVYNRASKDLQLSIMLGDTTLAIGYVF